MNYLFSNWEPSIFKFTPPYLSSTQKIKEEFWEGGSRLTLHWVKWNPKILLFHFEDNLKYTTAAAKSLQSCPTLCDPIDGSPPGSSIPGTLQARTLEWVAISFSITVINSKRNANENNNEIHFFGLIQRAGKNMHALEPGHSDSSNSF